MTFWPAGVAKSTWRRDVLQASGIDCAAMRTTDHLDAALAALTGLKFLSGEFCVVGTPGEALLVRSSVGRYRDVSRVRRGRLFREICAANRALRSVPKRKSRAL